VDSITQIKSVVQWIPNHEDVTYLIPLADEMLRDDDALVRGWGKLGRAYVHTSHGEAELAATLYEDSVREFERIESNDGLAEVYRHIGFSNYELGNQIAAIDAYTRSLEQRLIIGDVYGQAWMHINIGNASLQEGLFDAALEGFTRGIDLLETLGNKRDVATCNMNIGNIYGTMSDYAKAIEYYQIAYDLSVPLNQTTVMSICLNNMASMYGSLEQYNEALSLRKRALQICIDAKHIHEIPHILSALSDNYADLLDEENMNSYAVRAIEAVDEIKNENLKAYVHLCYANSLIRFKRYTDAAEHLEKFTSQNSTWRMSVIKSLQIRAEILEAEGHRDEALAQIEMAFEHARTMKSPRAEEVLHDQLRDIYKRAGDFEKFIHHNDAVNKIQQETRNSEVIARVAMQTKEKEIEEQRKQHEKHLAVLHATLPPHIAERVARGEKITDSHDQASVLFLDVVGFTTLSSTLSHHQIATLLDTLFGVCDDACKRHDVTKVKTIGDSFMALSK